MPSSVRAICRFMERLVQPEQGAAGGAGDGARFAAGGIGEVEDEG